MRVIVIGAGHNGLVAGAILAREGHTVLVLEAADVVGGACRTERPFARAPGLGCSTGAYLLGPMPPEVMDAAGIRQRVRILPRRPHGYLLLEDGSPAAFGVPGGDAHISHHDRAACAALDQVLARLRDQLAPLWLRQACTLEAAIEHIRPEPAPAPFSGTLRDVFALVALGPSRSGPPGASVMDLLAPLALESQLLGATIATDGLVGSARGLHDPGTAMNFLVHNMLRLPPGDRPNSPEPLGAWQLVEGGMGAITGALTEVIREHAGEVRTRCRVRRIVTDGHSAPRARAVELADGSRLDADAVILAGSPSTFDELVPDAPQPLRTPYQLRTGNSPTHLACDALGTSLKVNLALERLPRVVGGDRLPDQVRHLNPLCGTVHILPPTDTLARLDRARTDAVVHRRMPDPFDCMIDVYTHSAVDRSLCDSAGRHAMSLFVQWVPPQTSQADAEIFAHRLIEGPVATVLPELPALVVDRMVLGPVGIADRFGIPGGHIHHFDNAHALDQRLGSATPIQGVFLASAACHPAGSVIGCAGFIAASAVRAIHNRTE